MMRPITKFTRQIVSRRQHPIRVREAFRLGRRRTPGAVHLELPEDIADEEYRAQADPVQPSSTPGRRRQGITRAVAEPFERQPHRCLLIGAGANRKASRRMLTQFVDETGIPFVTTQMGKGVVG